MTDRDVMRRVSGLLQRALVVVKPKTANHRTAFNVSIKGTCAVQLMVSARPELGTSRRAQIDRALELSKSDVPAPPDEHEHTPTSLVSWLAGLLEGEGTFGRNPGPRGSYPVVSLEMSARDVVDRAARALGADVVHERAARDPSWSVTYVASISGAAAAEWMQRLRPMMGERRRAAIDLALDAYYPIRLTEAPDHCVVSGCDEPHRGRGLCHKHYMSWSRDVARGRTPRVRPLRSN